MNSKGDILAGGVLLDSAGREITRILPGALSALDESDNIYLAYLEPAWLTLPVTPGAFQTSHPFSFCSGTSYMSFPCQHQYVAKYDPTGRNLLFATYISGSYGAVPFGIQVDPDGSVYVAGYTNSPDYPTTPGTAQPVFAPAKNTFTMDPGIHPVYSPPHMTGYITRLSRDGDAVVWSTFFGGARWAMVTQLDLLPGDALYLAGAAWSPDLPGLCRPPGDPSTYPFIAMVSLDGRRAIRTDALPPKVSRTTVLEPGRIAADAGLTVLDLFSGLSDCRPVS